MNNNILVSIVTPTTGNPLLQKAVESVQRQDYTNIEYLIFIDGQEHEKKARKVLDGIKFRKKTHILCLPYPTGTNQYNGHRIYGASIYLINGDYIVFLDEDNWIEPFHISSLVDIISTRKLDWAYSLRKIVDDKSRFILNDNCESLGKFPMFSNENHHVVDTNCYLLKKSIAIEFSSIWYRRFRELNVASPDVALSNILVKQYPNCDTTGLYTVNYRIGSTGLSVKPGFFLYGNSLMKAKYPEVYPWHQNIVELDYREQLKEQFLLREINFIIFPDWGKSLQTVTKMLEKLVKILLVHPQKSQITLLIYAKSEAAETASGILYNVIINLLNQELDGSELLEITLLHEISALQWRSLYSLLYGHLQIELEDTKTASELINDQISVIKPNSLERLNLPQNIEIKDIQFTNQAQLLPCSPHFFIISHPGAGNSILTKILNCHPHIFCAGEVFNCNPQNEAIVYLQKLLPHSQQQSPLFWLPEFLHLCAQDKHRDITGFSLFEAPFNILNLNETASLINSGYKAIILRQRNASNFLPSQNESSDEYALYSHVSNQSNDIETIQNLICFENNSDDQNHTQSYLTVLESYLQSRQYGYLEVFYEDLCSSDRQVAHRIICDIFKYLEVDPIEVELSLQEKNSLIDREIHDITNSISSLLFNDQFNEATDACLKSLEENQNCLVRQFQLGLSLFLAGQEDSAQEIWMEAIIQEGAENIDSNTEALKQFLIEETQSKIRNNKDNQAGHIIDFLLEIDSENLWMYEELGNILFRESKYIQAIDIYLKAISLNSNNSDLFNKIGDSYFSIGDIGNSINWYNKRLILDSEHVETLLKIALALKAKGDFNEAKDYLHRVISLEGEVRVPFDLMSEICKEQGEIIEASLYEGLNFARNHKYEKAASELSIVLGSKFQSDRVFRTLYECYIRSGKYHEAAETIQQALCIYPNDITLRIKDKFVLPHLYESVSEIKIYREKYINGLSELIEDLDINDLNMTSALKAVSVHVNFYLSYQGYDDSSLQKQYGNFLHSVMQSNFPDWSRILPIQKIESSRRLRVGYLSYFFQGHTVCKLFSGWIRNANKEKFEIFTYHLGFGNDLFTQEIQNNSDHFYHYPSGFEEICQRVLEDKLDILVYPEIGMDSRTMKLAALRLAPVQCMSWGHPVTSGLPTIDYFLSSELMEPEDAQAHYSENLVQLPNLGISYELPSIPQKHLSREHFGIGADKIVYLSCQSIFKYLPQYDYIFAAIAQQVSNAQFVFISPYSSSLADQFIQRISRAFKAIGLNHEDYCIVVPRQDTMGYLSLNLIADIFLDTLAWTGGNTTLEAIACDLPIVTYPGQFMRGRHSYAMLKRMNMTDLIANTEIEYIQIAAQLGMNSDWREKIRFQISQSKSILFEDVDCISKLEKFYINVCTKI